MPRPRSRWRRLLKLLRLLLFFSVALTIVAGSGCVVLSSRAQRQFRPVHDSLAPALTAAIDRIPHYRRPEAATYLTLPEWYLVFNPQEYAQVLRTGRPSEFPYFQSIDQLWYSYIQVAGIADRHYPFDYGAHLMVAVIGVSTTVEYTIKGLYENTVGRLFEWTAGDARTAEEEYAAQVAAGYGKFVETRPWFDFPFGRRLAGVWRSSGFFGPHFARKLERKFFLTLEYGVKSVYAALIRAGSHSVYGVADTEVYATVRNLPEPAAEIPAVKRITTLADGSTIITVPHYQGFTDTVPVLAAQGVDFVEVAGNDEILVTIIAPAAWSYNLPAGRQLFTMESLTGAGLKRVAIQAPIRSLGALLRDVHAQHLRVEHLFDY